MPPDGLSPEQMRELLLSQQKTIAALTENVGRLEARIAELTRMLFGKSSERVRATFSGPRSTWRCADK